MTMEPRHPRYGYTLSEAIDFFAGGLDRDAIGLWNIVPVGRDAFKLKGGELTSFVRRSIQTLLDAGAVPVRGGSGTGYEWIAQSQYGSSRDEITEAVLDEWLALPDDPLVLCGDGVWFARPDPAFPKYVKVD